MQSIRVVISIFSAFLFFIYPITAFGEISPPVLDIHTLPSSPDIPAFDFSFNNSYSNQLTITQEPSSKTIKWSGYTWNVKKSPLTGPQYNAWSDTSRHVRVDKQGRLHLKISKETDGKWYCAEIFTDKRDPHNPRFGYGRYAFQLKTLPSLLDTNAVLGLFYYNERDTDNNDFIEVNQGEGEIDFEFGKKLNDDCISDTRDKNAQYTLQNLSLIHI